MIEGKNHSVKKALLAQHRNQEKDYWLRTLTGIAEPAAFPYDHHGQPEGEMAVRSHVFAPGVAAAVARLSARSDPKRHVILVAALHVLLYKCTQRTDLVTATPIYTPGDGGAYLNTVLPVRLVLQPEWTSKELLVYTRQVLIEANQHQHYPVDLLPEQLPAAGASEAVSLFKTAVVLDTIQDPAHLQPLSFQYRMIFCFSATETQLSVAIQYDASRYAEESIRDLARRLEWLLHQMTTATNTALADLSIVPEAERQKLLFAFTDTRADFPADQTLVSLFETQAARTPDQVACEDAHRKLTYRELNEQANQLAHYLKAQHHLGAREAAGLLVDRSVWVLVGVLGILKAGAAYVPIHTSYPPDRIRYMLHDTAARVVLTDGDPRVSPQKTDAWAVVNLPAAWPAIRALPTTNPPLSSGPDDLVYMMYTSGSTGKPKGVEISHTALVNFYAAICKATNLTGRDRILAVTTYTFDISVLELLVPLLTGAQVFVLGKEGQSDPSVLQEAISRVKPTILQATPSSWKMLLKNGWPGDPNLKAFCGGEPLSPELAGRLLGKVGSLWNLYGPTEATIWATVQPVTQAERITIGKPLQNVRIYILDSHLHPVPIGMPGEIHIGGICLSNGYRNRPELTGEKFIPHPLLAGEKIYKTGDLGRWLPNGEIECLGRIDHQVKIRGHRIELGEIEQTALGFPGIAEVVVIAADRQDEKFLCAYLATPQKVNVRALREHLLARLPAYMVPVCFVQVERIPLTPNGKVDRKALPPPQWHSVWEYVKPANATEQKLVEIWAAVLETAPDEIGVQAEFFELGGHSLKAAMLVNEIHQGLGVKLSVAAIFKHPTIRKLAQVLAASEKSPYQHIEPAPVRPVYPASSGQKRMYILSQLEADIKYNFPLVLRVQGRVDGALLQTAFRQLLQRHESLRTSFEIRDGELVQRVHPVVDFSVQWLGAPGGRPEVVFKSFFRPFRLDQAPIFRVGLLELPEQEHLLLIDLHHIVADGVSLNVLMDDLALLYRGERPPALKLQGKDYTEWQRKHPAGQNPRPEQYWLGQFRGEIPVLNLPTDYPRPAVQSFAGDIVLFEINPTLTAGLHAVARQEEVTLFMVLLAAYNTLLYAYTGQTDIVVGSPVVGRPHSDLQRVVGMFANTLALRNQPAGPKTFTGFLAEVRENTLNALENESYPFEELVEKLALRRDPGRNPLFDTMLSLQNTDRSQLRMGDLRFTPYPLAQKTSIFDLTFEIEEAEGRMKVCIQYGTRLFKPESIHRMKGHFIRLLEALIANPGRQLGQIRNQLMPDRPT